MSGVHQGQTYLRNSAEGPSDSIGRKSERSDGEDNYYSQALSSS